MIKQSKQSEMEAIMAVADAMCLAARTAPKARGKDYIETAIVTGDEKEELAKKMEELGDKLGLAFFSRDAQNLRVSDAVVLIGEANVPRGLNEGCQYCGFDNCKECQQSKGYCAYTGVDLGIAVGSAAGIAADARADNRIMFSVGRAAMEMNLLGDKVCQAFGIPLSASGKSPFFDR